MFRILRYHHQICITQTEIQWYVTFTRYSLKRDYTNENIPTEYYEYLSVNVLVFTLFLLKLNASPILYVT